MRQQALIGALIVVGASVPAQAAQLDSDDLRAAVAGKTVTIDTPLGLPITVNYGANGLMTGTAGTALAVYLGAGKDRGRWQVREGKLCQKWFKWLSGDVTCLTLRRDGSKIYWRSDEGQTGTASIEVGPPAFDGVSASGLGLPPPPQKAQTEAVATAPQLEVKPAVPAPIAQKPWSSTVVGVQKVSPELGREMASDKVVTNQAVVSLIGDPQLLHAIAPAVRPRVAMASLAPVPRPTASSEPVGLAPAAVSSVNDFDLFAASPHPMRRAVDSIAEAALEHRWCHSNAFAKEPSAQLVVGRFAAPELVSVPSLLAVAQEMAYEGELPLHAAGCLTEDPAINVIGMLSLPVE